jgi:hypothetical protein
MPSSLMDHAINNNCEQLSKPLGFDAAMLDTVVEAIDTYNLWREPGWWNSRNKANLHALVA